MLRHSGEKRVRSNQRGSAITEFGPAMGLLFIAIFFPLVDLLSMCVAYGCVMVLNNNQVHEASLIKYQEAEVGNGPIMKGIPDRWLSMGFGQYVKVVGPILTTISWRDGQSGSDGQATTTDKLVAVQTTVTCSPMLPIPLPIVNCPGLNGPMTFSVGSERPMENPDYGKP